MSTKSEIIFDNKLNYSKITFLFVTSITEQIKYTLVLSCKVSTLYMVYGACNISGKAKIDSKPWCYFTKSKGNV